MHLIKNLYKEEAISPLLTDRYHITTAYCYWLEGRADMHAVFYAFVRSAKSVADCAVFSGTNALLDLLKLWQDKGFTSRDLAFLRRENFSEDFLRYLESLKFHLTIEALQDGTIFFPYEPIIRVKGPIVEAKLFESAALCILNGHCGYATHAFVQSYVAKMDIKEGEVDAKLGMENRAPLPHTCNAKSNTKINVQGLRRGPTLASAIESSGVLVRCGYDATSTGKAAMICGDRFAGTMDHAWIMTHENELGDVPLDEIFALYEKEGIKSARLRSILKRDAFRSFAFVYPNNAVFIADTYDPLKGTEKIIQVIRELKRLGYGKRCGIRFDSGDLVCYAKNAFQRFIKEGWVKNDDSVDPFVAISDNIDESRLYSLRKEGVICDSWGIGTAGANPQFPAVVYKICGMYEGAEGGCKESIDYDRQSSKLHSVKFKPVMKLSMANLKKISKPGLVNSCHLLDQKGERICAVLIYDEKLGISKNQEAVEVNDVFKEEFWSQLEQGIELNQICFGKDVKVPIHRLGEKFYKMQDSQMKIIVRPVSQPAVNSNSDFNIEDNIEDNGGANCESDFYYKQRSIYYYDKRSNAEVKKYIELQAKKIMALVEYNVESEYQRQKKKKVLHEQLLSKYFAIPDVKNKAVEIPLEDLRLLLGERAFVESDRENRVRFFIDYRMFENIVKCGLRGENWE